MWAEERELFELNKTELEDAVFRFRKGERLAETLSTRGIPYTAAQAISVPLPIEGMEAYKRTER